METAETKLFVIRQWYRDVVITRVKFPLHSLGHYENRKTKQKKKKKKRQVFVSYVTTRKGFILAPVCSTEKRSSLPQKQIVRCRINDRSLESVRRPKYGPIFPLSEVEEGQKSSEDRRTFLGSSFHNLLKNSKISSKKSNRVEWLNARPFCYSSVARLGEFAPNGLFNRVHQRQKIEVGD